MGYYEIDRCPYCRSTLDIRRGAASDTTIGPPVEACPKCGGLFKTGRTEWANKTAFGRAAYRARVVWWVFGESMLFGCGGGGIITGVVAFIILKWKIDSHVAHLFAMWTVLAVGISALCVSRTIRIAKGEINDSLARTGRVEPARL